MAPDGTGVIRVSISLIFSLFIFKLLIKTLTSHLLVYWEIVYQVLIVIHQSKLSRKLLIEILLSLLLVVDLLKLVEVALQLLFRLILVSVAELLEQLDIVVVR